MDIGGNKLKAVEIRLEMINKQIDQTTGLKNKANVAVKTAKRYYFIIPFYLYIILCMLLCLYL